MENKMAEVAKLLGVELGEEFGLKNSNFRYKLTTNGLRKRHITLEEWGCSNMLDDILLGRAKIIKIAKPILDAAEKRYLTNIIKPFRDRILWIKKISSPTLNYEYIKICYRDNNYTIVLDFPDFKEGTMYKGMELKKDYTLEELGLKEASHGKQVNGPLSD